MTRESRTTLARPALAARALEGLVRAAAFADTTAFQVVVPATAQRAGPDDRAEQVNQLLFGETFDVLEAVGDYVWGQARRDGYVGWMAADALDKPIMAPNHGVKVLRTAAFTTPSIKSSVWGLLSLNALVAVTDTDGDMALIAGAGWVAARHLAPIGTDLAEPAAAAELFIGAPYVWGGRDSLGLDCSGLVQQALFAAAVGCPRDADQQSQLGRAVDPSDLRRGDLVFWPGHVGMMVDRTRLLHANAHHMAVAVEPLADAVQRIAAAGAGRPSAYRRLAF